MIGSKGNKSSLSLHTVRNKQQLIRLANTSTYSAGMTVPHQVLWSGAWVLFSKLQPILFLIQPLNY